MIHNDNLFCISGDTYGYGRIYGSIKVKKGIDKWKFKILNNNYPNKSWNLFLVYH